MTPPCETDHSRRGSRSRFRDKLRIATLLDELGVGYVEGGWPGANPKDNEFFKRAKSELEFSTATLTAFGSTRRPRGNVEGDPQLHALLEAETEVICIVGKSWDYHVREALRADLDEGVAMVAESIEYLKRHDRRVFFDAEHFFRRVCCESRVQLGRPQSRPRGGSGAPGAV